MDHIRHGNQDEDNSTPTGSKTPPMDFFVKTKIESALHRLGLDDEKIAEAFETFDRYDIVFSERPRTSPEDK